MLDEQPLCATALATPHANKNPTPFQTFAVQDELEVTALIAFPECVLATASFGLVGPTIPEHDRSAAVLPFGNGSLEGVVLDRMVLHLHGQSSHGRVVARPLRHGPTLHHPIELETEVEMEMARSMLLHDEAQHAFRSPRNGLSRGL